MRQKCVNEKGVVNRRGVLGTIKMLFSQPILTCTVVLVEPVRHLLQLLLQLLLGPGQRVHHKLYRSHGWGLLTGTTVLLSPTVRGNTAIVARKTFPLHFRDI